MALVRIFIGRVLQKLDLYGGHQLSHQMRGNGFFLFRLLESVTKSDKDRHARRGDGHDDGKSSRQSRQRF